MVSGFQMQSVFAMYDFLFFPTFDAIVSSAWNAFLSNSVDINSICPSRPRRDVLSFNSIDP